MGEWRTRVAIVLAMSLVIYLAGEIAQAQRSESCKVCSEQQGACMKNYAGKTCKTEYEMCLKSCQRKYSARTTNVPAREALTNHPAEVRND